MYNLDQVKKDIEQWIVNFVEVPHPALGNFPPCPYARKARLNNEYDVRLGNDPYTDLHNLSKTGLGGLDVVVLVYNPVEFEHKKFAFDLACANRDFLLDKDLLVLEDHPGDVENVNGVIMNQGTYAMALVQSLSDLNEKARLVARKGFYDSWPEDYLQALFQHREDPRQ